MDATAEPAVGTTVGFRAQMLFLLSKSLKLKLRNKLLTAGEILLPIYVILFMLLIMRLEIIPFEVIRTPAAEAPPRHSIFWPPPLDPWQIELSQEQREERAAHVAKFQFDTDPIRIGLAPRTAKHARAVKEALKEAVAAMFEGSVFGENGVELFDDEDQLYGRKSRFDNVGDGLDFGVIIDDGAQNFTIVHHELLLLNTTSGDNEEGMAVQGRLVAFQAAVSRALADSAGVKMHNRAADPEILLNFGDNASSVKIAPFLRQFPMAEHSVVLNILKWIFAFQFIQVLMMNFMGPMIRMAQEKEKGIKNALLLKGMSPVAYWASWLISETVTILLSALVCVCMIYACRLMLHTNAGLVFGAFFLFGLSNVAFAFVISFCAERAYTLAMFGALFNMLCIALWFVVQIFVINKGVAAGWVALTFLLPPIPFGHILYEIYEKEVQSQAWTPGLSPYGVWAYVFFAVDLVLWMTACLLIEYSESIMLALKNGSAAPDPDPAVDGVNGIVVRGLKKTFIIKEKNEYGMEKKKEVLAVNGLDLTVSTNTIFCLLGHNGAGKTTTMSIITGSLAPDEGWATVAGFDVVRQRAQLRKSLGVCPQFDVLYKELTVWEHMQLYGGMQGLSPAQCDSEGTRLLGALDLLPKKDQLSKNMSGGQQRRLSLAVSLIGAPKVVLLDEPTTGLDPANRRRVWKLLQEQKKLSTIIMTTHSMEEADLLADSIGVMSKGQIQASGSTLELKKQFGTGYLLHILKAPGFDEAALLACVHSHVSDVVVSSNVSGEMALSLPLGGEPAFPRLFQQFEADRTAFGLASYSLSMSTLEEVFLRLAEDEKGGSSANLPAADDDKGMPRSRARSEGWDGDVAMEVQDAAGVGAGDVWVELETFECEKSAMRQVSAVIVAVFKAAARHPVTFLLIIWQPVLFSVLTCLAVSAVQQGAPVAVSMLPTLMSNTSVSVAFDRNVSQPVRAQCLKMLGSEFQSNNNIIEYPDEAALNKAMLLSSSGNASCSMSAFFEVDANTGSGNVTLGYNKREVASARVLVSQFLNATARLSSETAFPDGLGCSYKVWRSPAYSNGLSSGFLTLIVVFAFNALAILFAMDMVRLRVSRVKDMFLLSGLPRFLFWLSHGLGHLILYFVGWAISCLIIRFLGAHWGMTGMTDNNFLGYFLIHLMFAPNCILVGYIISFFFDSDETAQIATDQIANLPMVVALIIMGFVVKEKNFAAENLVSLIPGYALYRGYSVLETAALNETPLSASDIFVWEKEVAQCLLMLIVDFVLLCGLLWLLDTGLLSKFAKHLLGLLGNTPFNDKGEADLQEEEAELAKRLPAIKADLKGREAAMLVLADEMAKTYCPRNAPPTWACRGVSLEVARGTVYGLLGPNGAGKSTMMSMLTGIEVPDSGDGYIFGKSVTWDLETARLHIGLCPQFDALVDKLTAREHLVLLAEIRGVPKHLVSRVVERAIADMALTEKAGAVSQTYSGGNKRKLSVAMSIVANPKVSFLDEPSTGMDPETRRHMWSFISRIAQSRAVVLTTHSMEEADALCSQIGLMIHGNLRAQGTSQELKNSYGTGYLIQVRFADNSGQDAAACCGQLLEALKQLSGGVTVADSATRAFRYELPQADVAIGPLFKVLLDNQGPLAIEDFSVSQATLEEVFLFFARQQ